MGSVALHHGPAALLVLICIAMLVFTATYFQQARHFTPIVRLSAASIKAGGLSSNALQKIRPALEDIVADNVCRADILRAGTRLLMLDVEHAVTGRDKAVRADALAFAEGFFRHALGCSPQNGDFWLRLAMIRGLRQPFPAEIARLMTLSQTFAPVNGNVLQGRYAVWTSLPESSLSLTRPARDADFAIICSEKGEMLRKVLREKCGVFPATSGGQPGTRAP